MQPREKEICQNTFYAMESQPLCTNVRNVHIPQKDTAILKSIFHATTLQTLPKMAQFTIALSADIPPKGNHPNKHNILVIFR